MKEYSISDHKEDEYILFTFSMGAQTRTIATDAHPFIRNGVYIIPYFYEVNLSLAEPALLDNKKGELQIVTKEWMIRKLQKSGKWNENGK